MRAHRIALTVATKPLHHTKFHRLQKTSLWIGIIPFDIWHLLWCGSHIAAKELGLAQPSTFASRRTQELGAGIMSNMAFFERFVLVLRNGDFDALDSMVTRSFRVKEASGLPYAGTYQGVKGFRELSLRVYRHWKEFTFETLEVFDAGSKGFVVLFRITGRSRKTGRDFDTTTAEIWRMEGGLLAEIVPYYWDTLYLAQIDGAEDVPTN